MAIRFLAAALVLALSVIINTGQTQGQQAAPAQPSAAKPRDLPFPGGVDLQFIIKELARDLDLNVLFDSESFRAPGRCSSI